MPHFDAIINTEFIHPPTYSHTVVTAVLQAFQLPVFPPFIFFSCRYHLSLFSFSPRLQAVEGLVYVLLVEAGHIGVHLFVVVPYVSLCAAIGHSTKAEWRGEIIWMLKLDKREKGQSVRRGVISKTFKDTTDPFFSPFII